MQRGEVFDRLTESMQKHATAVPTKDIDIKRMLRQLGEPICLFGEDPIDRRNRLKHVLASKQATNLQLNNHTESDTIAKHVTGGAEVAEIKAFLIDFSIPRAQRRIANEQRITQPRVDELNSLGREFSNYVLTASEFVEKRPLTHVSITDKIFAVASLSGTISTYDIESMEQIDVIQSHEDRITGLAFVGDVLFSTSTDGTMCSLNGSEHLNLETPIHCVAAHPSTRIALCGMSDGTFCVYDRETGKVVSRMKSSDGVLSTLACHGDGGVVLAGGADTVARLWDLRSMHSIKVLRNHTDTLTCSLFDAGFHALTGSADSSMICWDMRNLERSKRIGGHTGPVSSISLRGDILMSSSFDKTIKIWSMLDFRTYHTITDCPYSISGCVFGETTNSRKPLIISVARDGSWRYHSDDFL